MQFIIIHGSFGSPEENWFPWLKNELEKIDQLVITPRFPVDDWDMLTSLGEKTTPKHQNLNSWLNTLGPHIETLKNNPTVMVGHSLGPLFILHALEKYSLQFDCGIFVSPFLSKLNRSWQIDVANQTFYRNTFKPDRIRSSFLHSYVLHSDNDPYVDQKYTQEFIELTRSQSIEIKGGGHLSASSGFTQFPLVLELCKTRISSNNQK